MPYSEILADKLRIALAEIPMVEEKEMFGGLAFMVDDKMCLTVSGDELMCRIDPALTGEALQHTGTRPMIMRGREYKGYLYIAEEGWSRKKEFEYWVMLALDFNKRAKASKKKKK